MARGAFELELKFTGAPQDIANLQRARFLTALAIDEGHWARLRSVYFDTLDEALAREGVALRLREESGRRIQTVKRATAAGAIVREEFECVLEEGAAFPQPVGDDDIDELLRDHAGALTEIAEIRVDRWTQAAKFGASEFEIAIDHGSAHGWRGDRQGAGQGAGADGGAAPIAEIEIEFKRGEMADLFNFGRLLADNAPVRLSARTKLETARAAGAGAGAIYKIDKLEKPEIDPDAPSVEALQAMLAAIAVRIINIQEPLLDLRAARGVHQMRVALRRFRAIERTFRRVIDTDTLYALTRRARSIAHALGPARDLDVFVNETLPDVFSRYHTPPGAADMRANAEALRAAAWANAHAVIADKSFTHFTLDLLEAGVLAPWRAHANNLGGGPLHIFAPIALDRALKRSRKAEAAMDRNELAARHPLRIALKKQRYAAQMLGSLYPRETRKPYMRVLSRLQSALGAVNDAVVAQELAEETGAGAGKVAMRAAGFVAGFKAAEAEAAAAEIDRAWELFDKTPPFWREENALNTDYPLS